MTNALIRPAWTPVTIAMMVIGFMIAWPLGLAMIAYIIWGDRLDGIKKDVNRATDKMSGMFKSAGAGNVYGRTGNVAFDEWREAEIERLNEERRKLDEERAEFETYMREARREKDRKDFEAYMSKRNKDIDGEAKPATRKRVKKSGGKTVPGV